MKKPTKEELENAAVAAETGEWTEDHPCENNYVDVKGNPWPGQCLDSLSDYNDDILGCNFSGVIWLSKNLPKPYRGTERDGTGSYFKYTKFIDNGKGKEVAAAIRSLI